MRVSLLVLVLAAAGAPLAAQSKPVSTPTAVLVSGPQVGHSAPDFTLAWANKDGVGPADNPYQLWRDRGKTVVLAFFPKDFTSGCTAQMQTFAEQFDTLFGPDVIVVGINGDSLETHQRFAAKLGLPFRLLTDPDLKVARRYGSYDGSGRPRRTIFVVAPDGRVHYRNLKFNPMDPKDYSALGTAVREARGS
ncbi:MAG TPA: redoxin domain-containing protein [Gemmatimonadales bacterium]|nr:redoxin domain-containing protein [Gemmatimonadales bacterium]